MSTKWTSTRERVYEVVTKSGRFVGLYERRNATFRYVLSVNGVEREFKFIGDANRAYNEAASV